MDQAITNQVKSQPPEASLAFEVYGDSTLAAEASASGVRLQLGPYQLLFDCNRTVAQVLVTEAERRDYDGQNIDSELNSKLGSKYADPPIDFAFCSHVQASRGLPTMHLAWPELPILASQATHRLLPLTCPELEGSVACQALPWREPLALTADLSVELLPAGHVPGAAVIVLTYYPRPSGAFQPAESETSGPETPLESVIRVAYVGGCFLSGTRCVAGLELNMLRGLSPDLLITGSAYGTQQYPRRRLQENAFVELLLAALAQGRSVLMPVPTFGIAQEVILLLRSHHRCTGQAFEIWVDEPVAAGCDRYLDLLDEMPIATQNFARRQALFWDERVRPHVHRFAAKHDEGATAEVGATANIARPLNKTGRPRIVLAHLESNWGQIIGDSQDTWELWLDRTAELLPNASGWAKHQAFAHQSAASLEVLTTYLQTGQLHLSSYQLTDRCDGIGITQLIHNLRPEHLLLHGSNPQLLQQLSELEELRRRYRIYIGEPGVKISLKTKQIASKRSVMKPTSVRRYSAELMEDSDDICLQIDSKISRDPHWRAFAETGLLEVEWQAEGLLIRGLSPQALSARDRQKSSRRQPTDACQTCAFYQNRRCCNPASPLAHIQVPADSYCDEFRCSDMAQTEKS